MLDIGEYIIDEPYQQYGNGYDQLDGEWLTYYKVATKYVHKARFEDRDDLLHTIILNLAVAGKSNGHKPDNASWMYRIASFTVAQYWRDYYYQHNGIDCGHCSNPQRKKCKRDNLYGSKCPRAIKIESLQKPVVDGDGHISELGDLIADNKALDLAEWLDNKTFLLGCPQKLIDIAEKIKERTGRGKRARAREGRMSGGFHITYGYDYIPVNQKDGGRRIINETEAKWVRQVYHWLANDGLTAGAIRNNLTALNVPTKKGRHWSKVTILSILKNPAYTGKTYAFTCDMKRKPRRKPQEDWIEIPDVTPAIISQELFEAAQKQLQVNRAKAIRNTRREYLLRGHIKCRQCGHAYVGGITRSGRADGSYRRLYRCLGKWKDRSPFGLCQNKSWGADKLETLVWQQIERILEKPELIVTEIKKQRQNANQLGVFETELQQVERQLRALDRDQEELLQWALKGFPEETVVSENKRINGKRITLQAHKVELETQVKASNEAVISLPKLERFVELMRGKISALDFESKCQALDMLGITVWLDGQTIEITGVLDTEGVVTADMLSQGR